MARGQTLNAFWHGRPLPALHWACLASFPARGHRLRLWCYDSIAVPEGVERVDAGAVLPAGELFEYDGSFSAFSNLFRYELLLREGGWWVDADVVCLREDLPDAPWAWAEEDAEFVNGAILRFPAGDPTLLELRDAARAVGRGVRRQGELGPRLLSRVLRSRQFPGRAGSTALFYPLHWLEAHRAWMPGQAAWVRDRARSACFLHLWGMMYRYLGLDLGRRPPAGSFLAELVASAGFPGELAELDEAARLQGLRGIAAFLSQDEYRARSRAQLGYDVFADPGLAEVL